MRVSVSFFASHREIVGGDEITMTLPDHSSLDHLAADLGARFPGLISRLGHTRFAINEEYCDRETPLHDGDRVALIPPVSGG